MGTDNVIKSVGLLIKMHHHGLIGGEIMPEDALIGVVPEDELLDVLTLGMSLNYQRNSYKLWEAIAQTYLDKSSRWVFNTKAVAERNLDDLKKVLIHNRVALQPNRHPEIWKRVSEGFVQSSLKGDVMGLIQFVQFDISALKEIMQIERKPAFPYLSGPKIFNYWLYVLETYAGVCWESRDLITIAPDTHIIKASVKLGLCPPEVLNGTTEDRRVVAAAWEEALIETDLAPIDIHTPLWLWSRAGFPSLTLP